MEKSAPKTKKRKTDPKTRPIQPRPRPLRRLRKDRSIVVPQTPPPQNISPCPTIGQISTSHAPPSTDTSRPKIGRNNMAFNPGRPSHATPGPSSTTPGLLSFTLSSQLKSQATPRMCKFETAKELGCRKCFLGLLDEGCISIEVDSREMEMVSVGSWTSEQCAEAAAEKARLAIVEEVRAVVQGMTTHSSPVRELSADSLDKMDFSGVDFNDFDEDIEDQHRDQDHDLPRSSHSSSIPSSSPPIILIDDNEDDSSSASSWSGVSEQALPTCALDSPPPILHRIPFSPPSLDTPQPLTPTIPPLMPVTIPVSGPKAVIGYDLSVRFIFSDD
ncbi:hypothetical protein BGZ59_002924 [Podila verticillata]|nr:hypothetical protein BGZ59_002924 [Podila verticillata]